MTRAILQYLDSADVSVPLDRYRPAQPDDFQLQIDAAIGADDRAGADIFHFRVVSSKAIRGLVQAKGSLWLSRCLVVEHYDYGVIHRAIGDLCDQATGEDWQAVAAQIGRFSDWEFADYDEYRP